MKNIIAGTAGHIDHGKTALVKALTGIDTDRLEEEKRRGISIDLGFAHLELAGGLRIGLVDVPGHERFIRNMLAGAAGIDMVLFVVAADESIKPQTREHFEICRLLGIERGVIVLTKADLVEADLLELVRLEVEEFVADSFLAGAPMVAVSSTTGAGLDELRARIADVAAAARAKDVTRPFRLPIDRAFSMRGFGAVITGTLTAGSVSREQEIELHPLGRRVRVRGIQVHGEAAQQAHAGQRTALNIAGAEPSEIARGMTATEPGLFRPVTRLDCALDLLRSASPMKHGAPVHFHSGTAEVEACVRLLESLDPVRPGSRALVRLHLRDPLLVLPGDRFILRMFSPVVTIAGGSILDIDPPTRLNRPASAKRLGVLEQSTAAERVALLVRESKYGLAAPELVARTGLGHSEIERVAGQSLLRLGAPPGWLVDRSWFDQTIARLARRLEEFHRKNPLLPGMPREELRGREIAGAPPFVFDALIAGAKPIAAEGEILRLRSHSLALRQDEEQALEKIERAFAAAGLKVPPTPEVLAKSGVEAARARSLLQILLRDKKLVRVGEELVFHSSAIVELRALLGRRKGARFAVPEFKDWTGVSRKYAIPLLEFLDREHITRREGDSRVVL